MMAKGTMVGLLSALALTAVCGALAAATTVAPALNAPTTEARALFFDYQWVTSRRNGTQIVLHRPVEKDELPILYSSLEFENLRYWGYASVVDNGTH